MSDALTFEDEVLHEYGKLRAREEAKKRYREEKFPPVPIPDTLDLNQLAIEDEIYRIDKLWPVGDKVLLAAEAKAGKTVLIHNVLRSLLTGEPLFGEFKVKPVEGTVAILDAEMNSSMLQRWLLKQGIADKSKIKAYPLRGKASSFQILDKTVLLEWAERLKAQEVEVLMIDPMGPFLSALGLNENTEAREFLYAIDELADRAGITDYLVTHHMGHNDDRARGDSAILGWPAVTWNYKLEKKTENRRTKSDHKSVRSINVVGRVEEVDDFQVSFDKETNHLTFLDVLQAPLFQGENLSETEEKIMSAVGSFSEPTSQNKVIEKSGVMKATAISIINNLVIQGRLNITDGPNRSKLISKSLSQTL